MSSEQECHDLKVQLTTVQGHHKEAMDQLAEKSKQLASNKVQLERALQEDSDLSQEVELIGQLRPNLISSVYSFGQACNILCSSL